MALPYNPNRVSRSVTMAKINKQRGMPLQRNDRPDKTHGYNWGELKLPCT